MGQSDRSLCLRLGQSGWDKATGACGCGLDKVVGTKPQEPVAWTKWLGQSNRSLWLGQSGWDKATGACGWDKVTGACGLDKVVGTKRQEPVVVAWTKQQELGQSKGACGLDIMGQSGWDKMMIYSKRVKKRPSSIMPTCQLFQKQH